VSEALRSQPLRRFKPYPAYKDSGVEWLGEIPAHWEVKRLKHLARIESGLAPPESYDRSLGAYPVYGSNGLIGYCDEFFVREETIAVGRVGASGSVNIVPEGSWVSDNALLLADLRPKGCLPWLRYVLETMNLGLQAAKNAQPIITGSFLGNQAITTPPESEQRAIAAFLDRETARIDVLVAKKERLIELLQEKRTALITRAVTKGLDPTVPMKDSGVEWLGEIPAHWEVKPIRALARPGYKTFTDGDWIESPFIRDEGIRLIQTGNVGVGEYREQGFRYIDEETFRAFRCTEVFPGDVLICRLADPVGRACLAPDLRCRMITSVDVCILKPAVDVHAAFVVYALSSSEYLSWLSGICRGGTRDRVSRSMLGAVRVQKPPLAEQRAIAAFLDRETEKIDALVAKVREAIEHLKEYRTALISAAVTGKIDVRESEA